ncbi:DUF6531 domain-containing protein [Rathayibacter tritici]|uniref:DUF6531 domain-containing protein n=3 Tax=Rathayibacter tritici TaxID=33888 RepID=UPI0015E466AF|nr:DUF6531 domain-containing protein [Rathayibacter tritici]
MADLGAIEENVVFSHATAEQLTGAVRSAAATIEGQAGSRAALVTAASAEFRGWFAELFAENARVASADAGELVGRLREVGDAVQQLAREALAEQKRRLVAREWKRQQDARNLLEHLHDGLFGEEEPPVGPPATPLCVSVDPSPIKSRQNPLPGGGGGGGGGTTSARPEDLRSFADSSRTANVELRGALASVRGWLAEFATSCRWGALAADAVVTGFEQWLSANDQDVTWAGTIAEAFTAAGGEGSVIALPDAALAVALTSAGVSLVRQDLIIAPPQAFGAPPTTGYADDPVNTATGNFLETEVDLGFAGGSAALRFARAYNSLDDHVGAFGRGWSSEAEVRLRLADDGATLVLADGRETVFPRRDDGWDRADGENLWLDRVGDALLVSDNAGGRWEFSASGIWRASSTGPGTRVSGERDAEGRLSALQHERGRRIDVVWAGERIAALQASDGRRVHFEYEGGVLVSATGPAGTRRYGWSEAGLLESVTDTVGVAEVRNRYDSRRRVVAQTSPFGRTTRFAYLPGRITVASDEDGTRANSWVADARGRLVGVLDPAGRRQSMSFDAHGNLLSATERDGATTVHAYDARGHRLRSKTPSGADVTVGWDEHDRVTTVVAESGAVTHYEYAEDADRNPSLVVDPEGGRTALQWTDGLLTEIVDPVGVRLRFGYDRFGDLIATTDADGGTARLERDEAGRVVAAVTPSGAVTRFRYDAAGRLLSTRDALGATWRYEYDTGGRRIAVVDPLGARTTIEHGEHGAPVTTVDPLGRAVSRVLDDVGLVSETILPDGSSWRFGHDALSRLTETVDPSGGVWRREHNATGALTATIDPTGVRRGLHHEPQSLRIDDGGAQQLSRFDSLGRLVRVEEQDETVALASYDLCGRPVELVDGEGSVTVLRRDAAGRVVERVSPTGAVTAFEYDDCGRPSAVIDPLGARTEIGYDRDSRRVRTVLPTGEVERIEYDAVGRVVLRSLPGLGTARFAYDALGRVVRVSDPWTGRRRFRYDAAGQLIEAVDGLGGVTRFDYDERGRNTVITDPMGGVIRRRFDACDRAVEVIDPLGRSTTAGYDAAGRQIWQRDRDGSRWERHYDSDGREKSFAIDGRVVSETHRDIRGRALRITDRTAPGEPVEHELRWDRCGRLIERRRGGRGVSWEYDADGSRSAAVHPDGGRTEYERDARGLVTAVAHPGLGRATFGYDRSGRLVRSSAGALAQEWVFRDGALVEHRHYGGGRRATTVLERDEDGRLSGVSGPDGSVAYRYDDAHQLIAAIPESGDAREWSFDAAGRLVREQVGGTVHSRHYDAGGRLIAAESSDGTRVEYVHDGLGRRIREVSSDGTERSYAWSAMGSLASVSHSYAGSAPRTTALWVDVLGDLASVDGTDVWWDDASGAPDLLAVGDSPVLRTPGGVIGIGDQWSDPGWRAERSTSAHDPWNPSAATTIADGVGVTPAGALTFAGLEWMGHRAYDPATRGFLSTDPVSPTWGAAWSGNPYSFAGNDPVHALDPAGLSPVTDTQLQAYRDGNNGAFAAAGDWMAQNWEYIAGGAMIVAGGVLMATGVGGPIGAGLVGAGIDVIVQKATTGSVNWGQTALTAVTGGLGGSMTAARLGAAGISGLKAAVASEAASGAASGAAGDAYAYATGPGPHTVDGFLQASGGGAIAGAAMGAGGPLLGRGLTGAGRAGGNLLGKEADALTPDITTPSEPLNAVKPVPEEYINLASPSRTRHILEGDGTSTGKAGGHRWTDSPDRDPNKTRFPAEWSDAKIMHEVSDVATDPSLRWKQNKGPLGSDYAKNGEPSRILVEGLRDGVTIRVIVEPIGEGIITAFPIN